MPPKLATLAANKLVSLSHQLVGLRFGLVPYHLLRPLLSRLNAKQLAQVEHHNPHLKVDSDHLWAALIAKDFPQRPATPNKLQRSHRELYSAYAREWDTFREDSAIKLREMNDRLQREKAKTVAVEHLREPCARRRFMSRSYGPVNSIVSRVRRDIGSRPKIRPDTRARVQPIRRTEFNTQRTMERERLQREATKEERKAIQREATNRETTNREANRGNSQPREANRNSQPRETNRNSQPHRNTGNSQPREANRNSQPHRNTGNSQLRENTSTEAGNSPREIGISPREPNISNSPRQQLPPAQGPTSTEDDRKPTGSVDSPIVVRPRREPSIFLRRRPPAPPKKKAPKRPPPEQPPPSRIKRIKSSVFN